MKLFHGWLFVVIICGIVSCAKKDVQLEQEDEDMEITNPPVASFNVNKEVLLQLVNDVRKAGCNCGNVAMPSVSTITWNDLLATASYYHSRDMNDNNYFNHTGADGSSPGDRITAVGYKWRSYGENIAWGQPNEKEVINSWLKSEGHCRNIMNANFKEMGVARAGAYWTQVFGSR